MTSPVLRALGAKVTAEGLWYDAPLRVPYSRQPVYTTRLIRFPWRAVWGSIRRWYRSATPRPDKGARVHGPPA